MTKASKHRGMTDLLSDVLVYLGGALVIWASFFDWYKYPEGIDELGRILAHNTLFVCGLLAVALTLYNHKKHATFLKISNVFVSIIALTTMSQNHISQAPTIESIGVVMSGFYYVGIFGVVAVIIGTVLALVKNIKHS